MADPVFLGATSVRNEVKLFNSLFVLTVEEPIYLENIQKGQQSWSRL